MFSKNIKILSIFLILAVVMIGALSAVSAADPTTNATVDGDASVAQVNATQANATISGTITSTIASGNVSAGSAVNSSDKGSTYPSYIITVTTDKNASNVVSGVTASDIITLNENGSFNKNISFTGIDYLVNGNTYYICLTNQTAQYAAEDGNYSLVNTTNYFIPFDYVGAALTLDANKSTVSYGDAWTFSGVVTDIKGVDLYNQPVTVTVNNVPYTVYTDKNGAFFVNSTMFNSGNPLDVGTYAIVFNSTNTGNAVNATLNITKKQLVVVANLNETSINYGDAVNLTVTLKDANGNVYLYNGTVFGYTAINSTALTEFEGELTLANGTGFIDNLAKTSLPGTYWITVTNKTALNNFAITPATLILNINTVSTTLTPSADEFIVPSGTSANWGNFTLATANANLTGKTVTVVLYKADGTPVKQATATPAGNGVYTIKNATFDSPALANGEYYIKAIYAGSEGYSASNATVKVIIKAENAISANSSVKYTFNTTGNATIVNVTSTPVANTTLNVYVDGQNASAATVTITNGNGTFNLGDLSLPAGDHNVTFVYAGDDTYAPANYTTGVTVYPIEIGKLYINNTSNVAVTVNLTSEDTVIINLTNISNKKQLIDYTGNLAYTTNTGVSGNVSMVNGIATVKVTDLKGLTDGTVTYTFEILNDVSSKNTVTLVVTTAALNTKIVANNVTTNNATPIAITGTVANATEGNITVALIKNGTTVATTTTTVAADGTFTATFGNFPNGNYTANVTYNSTTGLSKNTTTNVSVIVNGTAPTPTPVGNITTVLTLNNFTEVVGAGQNLTGTLTDVNGTPIVGQHIALNLTNPKTGASKIYWVTTDTDGAFQLAINLAVGTYTASASYAGNSYDNVNFTAAGPVAGTITVTSNVTPSNKTATVLTAENYVANVTGGNFTGILTANGTPLVGQHITLNLTRLSNGMSKLYYATTDTDGAYQLEINLGAGNYTVAVTYDGTSVYDAASANGTIVMTRA